MSVFSSSKLKIKYIDSVIDLKMNKQFCYTLFKKITVHNIKQILPEKLVIAIFIQMDMDKFGEGILIILHQLDYI